MSAPRSITDFEFRRLAELAKQKNVLVEYQRTRGGEVIVRINPAIPATHKPDDIDRDEEIVL